MAKKHTPALTRQVGHFTLGKKYRDSVHNVEGVAVCYATHLTGCNRICLEWVNKEGEMREIWVDETRLVDEDGSPVIPAAEPVKNGPGGDPPRRGIR